MASKWKREALDHWEQDRDFWSLMFDLAHEEAQELNLSDMVPRWVVDGDCMVERRLPLLPYTREEVLFRNLKHQLAA